LTAMDTPSARMTKIAKPLTALVGTADPVVARRLAREIERFGGNTPPAIATSFSDIRRLFLIEEPVAVLIDESLLRGAPLAESLRQFVSVAPVIVLASIKRQIEAAPLVAEGAIEFVVREGEFFALAAGLIERRLRAAESAPVLLARSFAEWPDDIGEIFRHEINNPLTGILGNSELLLSHREHLTAADAQRLETIVGLAVRLRETIRRLSATLESPARSLKSA
jgi:signal transduction histidine kinase